MDGWMGRPCGGRQGWVSGPDGRGDHWMDGRMARQKGEWGGKVGVGERTGWMGRPLDGRADGPTDGRVNGAGRRRWVNGPDGWMDEETIELTGDPTDG